jgi:hypothetical protein
MKKSIPSRSSAAVAVVLLAIFNPQIPSAFAQGTLAPPGVPAPTMKSLDQIEARTPISSAPYTITNPGAYYLTGNLPVSGGNAITIVTNGVTLNLNGFTISTTVAANTGILLSNNGAQDVTILNGHIQGGVKYSAGSFSGSGFGSGINVSTPFGVNAANIHVSDVSVSGCGTNGIFIGVFPSTGVDHCNVYAINNTGTGIAAGMVTDCGADACKGTAINCLTAANCSGSSTASQAGINARSAVNCVGISSLGTGLNADVANGCLGQSAGFASPGNGLTARTASGCYGSVDNGGGTGVAADIATGCRAFSAFGVGLSASNALNCYVLTGSSTSNAIQSSLAENCFGSAPNGSGNGVSALSAQNCYGNSLLGIGVGGTVASGCYGVSSNYHGIFVQTALNCYGKSSTQIGIFAVVTENSDGESVSNNGIQTTEALNCQGTGFNAISATDAMNCIAYGTSTSAAALLCFNGVASNCRGINAGGTAINATIAIGSTGNGTIVAGQKFLGTP